MPRDWRKVITFRKRSGSGAGSRKFDINFTLQENATLLDKLSSVATFRGKSFSSTGLWGDVHSRKKQLRNDKPWWKLVITERSCFMGSFVEGPRK